MSADDLARRIVVRHRESGYLRFELPLDLCYTAAAQSMELALRQVAGVYRVACDARQRRLVVWFEFRTCSAADVARALKQSLANLPENDDVPAETVPTSTLNPASTSLRSALPALPEIGQKVGQVLSAARAGIDRLTQSQAPIGSIHARLQPVLVSALTEKAITNFLNDLVAFYLIKMHWELISKQWLKDPVKHASAWLTVFYLIFLLVRYRKKAAASGASSSPADTLQSGENSPS